MKKTMSQKLTRTVLLISICNCVILGLVGIAGIACISSGGIPVWIALGTLAALLVLFVMVDSKISKRMMNRINDPIKKLAAAADSISKGNLNIDIPIDSNDEAAALADSLKKMKASLLLMKTDIDMMVSAAASGSLDKRTDLNRHNGYYRDVMEGIHTIFDTVKAPLDTSSAFLDKLANGEHQADMENTYQGCFADMIENLNKVRRSVNYLVDETVKFAEAGKTGDLAFRGDTSKLKGVYAKIIEEMNDAYEAIKKPLDISIAFVGNMSNGIHQDDIENIYQGYYSTLVDNLNAMRHAIAFLVSETSKLAQAGAEGNLSLRGDESAHKGAIADIIKQLNFMMDSISKPLDEAGIVLGKMEVNDYSMMMSSNNKGMLNDLSTYINNVRTRLLVIQDVFTKLALGDISPLESFKKIGKRSDNDKIVPAGIAMMQNIYDLIEESNVLATAAYKGDLNTRGNADKFEGGYRQIIEGMNKTMEAVAAPIDESSKVLMKLAQGNLTVSMTGDYEGKYNEMKASINRAIESFNTLLTEINNAASQVYIGSKQVSDASQSLSQGASEQATAVEQLTSSITEIASQTNKNAMNATQASEITSTVQAEAAVGNEKMAGMLDSMNQINESSANISKIIKVIDDIAFQTNILALNAAVEAARAGQYGKGFAVVAEEVRSLAGKSAEAAKETTSLIEGSINKVKLGTVIANETADMLTKIVDSAQKSASLVSEIAKLSNEQASAIAQVDQGVNQVSAVVQTNSATAEESAASSEELAGQANMLTEMVGKFELKDTTSSEKSDWQGQNIA